MKRWLVVFAILAAGSLAVLPAGKAQEETAGKGTVFGALHFRDLGPAVAGGRVAAVVGIPGNPNVYYVGAAGGGVWKTADGGLTWKAIFEHEGSSSIGAIALAPSDPGLVWVGTGEANIRNDIIDGAGLYFSPDAGHDWQLMGFRNAGQISSILVDPHDPNTVFVGVLGNAWVPSADRGVFKTTDGGKTWKKVLFENDTTGAIDMVMSPDNSRVLFAAMWQVRRYPWTLDDGGPGSGIYRSTDGGDTWTRLSKGLPEGPLGRIAIAIAPTNPDHLYALVEAKRGLLWQSEDMGDSWTAVSDNHAIDVRPFYFSRLFVAPDNQDKLYFISYDLLESDDGGRTVHPADRGVHVDHHALWIDPANPARMIQGNDGGAYLSTDADKHWTFLDGMPIEEDYMAGIGAGHPYTLCAGLQDNNGWCGNEEEGWYVVAGGDGQYTVPAPSDPQIIYSDSQNGSISRLDFARRIRWSIEPYLANVEQETPSALKYRFNWTTPIAVSPSNPDEVYLGGSALFRSSDGGKTWDVISPDLTRNDKSKQITSGGPVEYDISGAETYDTIMSITIAPGDPNVIWVGSDDGLVHVTRNGGKSWSDVTPNIPGAPAWARVYQLGVSPFDPGAAYVSFDAHMLGDHHPYVYRTADYGKSWQKIVSGLPDEPVHVVREDPNHRGLLVLGCDTGLYLSTDNGDQWQPFPVDFPVVPVFDVQFVKSEHDLVLATHGRGLFVLDDFRPIEEMTLEISAADFHLFSINDVVLANRFFGGKQGQRSTLYRAPFAPQGAQVDYFLKTAIKAPPGAGGSGRPAAGTPAAPGPGGRAARAAAMEAGAGPAPGGPRRTPVKIVVTDDAGHTISTGYGTSNAGVNRFSWNLRYEGPVRYAGEAARPGFGGGGGGGGGFFGGGGGPEVAPGNYKVAVTVNGQTQSQTVQVLPDPSIPAAPGAFQQEVAYGLEVRDMTSAVDEMLNQIDDLNRQLAGFAAAARPADDQPPNPRYRDLLSSGRSLRQALDKLKSALFNSQVQASVPEDGIHYLADLHGRVQRLGAGTIGYGQPPSPQAREQLGELRQLLAQKLDEYDQLLKTQVAAYNRAAQQVDAPILFPGAPVTLPAAGKP